jgi:ABC-2 type transport system permease protein
MKNFNYARFSAVVKKEMRDYRRKRSIVATMAILPFLFLIEPVVAIFVVPSTSGVTGAHQYVILPILYLLLIPSVMPSTLAAFTVVGEREQGTLEPLLTTPISQQEFIAGKGAAVLIPTMAMSYLVYAVFLIAVELFAKPVVSSAIFGQSSLLVALIVLAPLLAGWSIAVGMAVSVRANEIRVAQQLGTLASFPPVVLILILAVGVIHPTLSVAIIFAVVLLGIDVRAIRIVAHMMNRERLVTGSKS